jgi:hypothetical protein
MVSRDFGDTDVGTLRHLRDVQRLRLEAEAQRLAQAESRLAHAQLALRNAQARLAIDRVRFAVHDLLGVFQPPLAPEASTPEEHAEPACPRLQRVK